MLKRRRLVVVYLTCSYWNDQLATIIFPVGLLFIYLFILASNQHAAFQSKVRGISSRFLASCFPPPSHSHPQRSPWTSRTWATCCASSTRWWRTSRRRWRSDASGTTSTWRRWRGGAAPASATAASATPRVSRMMTKSNSGDQSVITGGLHVFIYSIPYFSLDWQRFEQWPKRSRLYVELHNSKIAPLQVRTTVINNGWTLRWHKST